MSELGLDPTERQTYGDVSGFDSDDVNSDEDVRSLKTRTKKRLFAANHR